MRNRIMLSAAASVFAFSLLWGAAGSLEPTSWTFTSIDVPGADLTVARDMNPAGQIVGACTMPDANRGFVDRGFLLSNGVFTLIEIGDGDDARGINPEGDIVGWFASEDEGWISHGYLWREGNVTQFDYPGADYTIAEDINAAGDIVGFYGLGDTEHGFLLRDGVYTTIDPPDALLTNARGVNDRGDIVGLYDIVDQDGIYRAHGFLRSRDGAFTTIDGHGSPSSSANGINTRGQIVGTCRGFPFGFLLSQGKYTTIQIPGLIRAAPHKITSDGQHIVGVYRDDQGSVHGFMLAASR